MRFFPDDNAWYQEIDHLPVNEHSEKWVANIGRNANLHADFASGKWEGKEIGIPLNVYKTRADVPAWKEFSFWYAGESDHVLYPFGKVEEGSDRHLIVWIEDEGLIFEVFDCDWGAGKAGSGAVFRNNNERRKWGDTSADAAGLCVIAGLVRYEEVLAGYVDHAIRFTVEKTWGVDLGLMASHWTSGNNGELMAPTQDGAMQPGLGARFRLKADFDISSFHPFLHPILTAMKTFGIVLADNGSNWFISGVPDERWDNDILAQLKRIKGVSFEAVDCVPLGLTKESYAVKPQNVVAEIKPRKVVPSSDDATDKILILSDKIELMARQIDDLHKRYMV
jgi:hypothetical protein